MEANFIDNNSKPSARVRSTENLSRGRQFEDLAESYGAKLGYELLARNFRIGRLEADLLFRDRDILVLVEVRGRVSARFRPSRTLSRAKASRLQALASMLQRKWKERVRVEFFEITPEGTRRFVLHGPCHADG